MLAMSGHLRFIAYDLGAESGRAVLGEFDGKRLALRDIHRFPNQPVRVIDNLYWDLLRLFHEMKVGLSMAAGGVGKGIGRIIDGIGIDAWGVDFGLLDRFGRLMANPRHYRDSSTDGVMEEAFKLLPKEDIYRLTGLQFLKFNTLYQLVAFKDREGLPLGLAARLLFMPNLFDYLFTGEQVTESSIASTSQLYDPSSGEWSSEIIRRFGLPRNIFGEIVPSGTLVGKLLPSVAEETGAGAVKVIAPASHDTASAVAAVPAGGEDAAYISSGTWSLMGVELDAPVINGKAMESNFTNEGGAFGKTRLLKNIMGLWLVQECRRSWAREGEALDYDTITRMAEEALPFKAVIDPDSPRFLSPADMPSEIRGYCRETGQPGPEGKGEVVRLALEGLALKYRWTLERLEELLGRRLNVIHIVGGGSRNQLLCRFTADATGRTVVAGPAEATAIGNILMQAKALGHLTSLFEIREVVRNSFPLSVYEPQDSGAWDDAYGRLLDLMHAEGSSA